MPIIAFDNPIIKLLLKIQKIVDQKYQLLTLFIFFYL